MQCGEEDSRINVFHGSFKNELKDLSLDCRFVDRYPEKTVGQTLSMSLVNRLCRKNDYRDLPKYEGFLRNFGVYWNLDNRGDTEFIKRNSYILYGWFENKRWGNELGDSIKKEFTPNFDVLPENREFYDAVRGSNAVCLHARYYKNESNRVPDEAGYYRRAVEKICSLTENPVIFIFTNKPQWAQDTLKPEQWGIEYHFEPVFDDGIKRPPVETLRLMYTCRHFIISVSTFSWWAQCLGTAPDKTVIAPKEFRAGRKETPITEDSWIRV